MKTPDMQKIVGAVSMVDPVIPEGKISSINFWVNNYTYDMFVGVCRPTHWLYMYLGNSQESWALSLSSGKVGTNNEWRSYS